MRKLTRKGIGTRRRIVEGAAAQIQERGVAAVTLERVVASTGTSKGQLFYYFPGGRDELFLAVAQYEADRVLDEQQPQLGHLTSWPAWLAWRDRVVDHYRGSGARCALGDLAAQSRRNTPGARAVMTQLVAAWQAQLATGIRQMQEIGEIDPGLDAERAAAALLAGIQGGVAVLLATGSLAHLEAALDTGIESLRASRSASLMPAGS
ncbi:TetR/AcrR family transcriptional regulator [Micromonospora purpureochromogenes]|uniref:TetR/AcrR family transcriptional regulator n=1 Tax=Micromonospora purpureochromogenes TaxID=47872 RepID=UPI00331BE6CF